VTAAAGGVISVVSEVERRLAELRLEEGDAGAELRTSVMTHVAWAPPSWADAARRTLAGLEELHPSRTILLFPDPKRADAIDVDVSLHCFAVPGVSREVCSEVIELRLGGRRVKAPASIIEPLLIADLPTFCRWRGLPPWGKPELEQLVDVCDRLVVDSSEWRGLPQAYTQLAQLFDRIAASDIAWGRSLGWRGRLAALWPGIAKIETLAVTGPKADALLLAGWLRSRLRRRVRLTHRSAEQLERVAVDGEPVKPPRGGVPGPSELLSAELDVFGRDPVYEAAVSAAR
jgi:glucose-6-phosphate dehydrogenase assembly protein OpcA